MQTWVNLTPIQLVTSFAATVGSYGAYKLVSYLLANYASPVSRLPGPPSAHFIWGNLKEISEADSADMHEKWAKEYGKTMVHRGAFGLAIFYTTDLKALNHILSNSYTYQKPSMSRFILRELLGNGLIAVEGDTHKHQRRAMNPAFGAAQIRELTEIFVEKSIELRDLWLTEYQRKDDSEFAVINVLSDLSKTTLDVIGLAGFSYRFNCLSEGEGSSDLNRAFAKVFESSKDISVLPLFKALFPALRWLPTDRSADVKEARRTMDRIAKELFDASKAELVEAGGMTKGDVRSRDLLTLLLKANMAQDIPEDQRMSDEEVLAQVPTFLVAGHETTSTATSWALYALSVAQDLQLKLREELLTVQTDNPTMEELNALPYLDAVVRECLRIHTPVSATVRSAVRDDLIPLDTPVKDRDGKTHEFVQVRKGQFMIIPILAVNRDKEIWGDDGHEFKPERWMSLPRETDDIPGVWSHMLTFLGGPRACIGFRFALVETKALLFTLVRAFQFDLAGPAEDVGKKASDIQRPYLKSDPKAGNQLPLRVRPYVRA